MSTPFSALFRGPARSLLLACAVAAVPALGADSDTGQSTKTVSRDTSSEDTVGTTEGGDTRGDSGGGTGDSGPGEDGGAGGAGSGGDGTGGPGGDGTGGGTGGAGSGGAGAGTSGDGPPSCEDTSDCVGACPPESHSCVCYNEVCLPGCDTDDDCLPTPDGGETECNEEFSVCLRVE